WEERHYQGPGKQWVPFCRLDRQRNRVLYWPEQSSLNHNGRPHHGECDFHSELMLSGGAQLKAQPALIRKINDKVKPRGAVPRNSSEQSELGAIDPFGVAQG